jgi:hypothetical protein
MNTALDASTSASLLGFHLRCLFVSELSAFVSTRATTRKIDDFIWIRRTKRNELSLYEGMNHELQPLFLFRFAH